LHHLTKARETLGWQLLGKHNLHFYHQLMREIRESILADRFLQLYEQKRAFLHESDQDNPIHKQKAKRKRSLRLGDYEVHKAWEGFASIRQISSGEIMHCRTAPMEEAHKLYVEQSNLAERLRPVESEGSGEAMPLTVWDVGLGAAANSMAAIRCYEEQAAAGLVRPLHIISFENDLDSLRLAFRHNREFPYLRHSGPPTMLKRGWWRSAQYPALRWNLLHGHFLETMQTAPAPDLIFYDMFSSQSSLDQWTRSAFQQLFHACAGRSVELFTYTRSTANRAALLAAGFYVAEGRSAGEKEETTIALTPETFRQLSPYRHPLLGAEWLTKWDRSGAKFPNDMPSHEREHFEGTIRGHEQFRQI
jgi:queuine tRNA-ribosyltransferase